MLENIAYLESVFDRYRGDPASVGKEWRAYFNPAGPINGSSHSCASGLSRAAMSADFNEKLSALIRNFRQRGHLAAAIDPLGSKRRCPPELKLETCHFTETELDQPVNLPTLHFGAPLTVREIHERLQSIYCGSLGAQFMHIDDWARCEWLQRRLEGPEHSPALSRAEQLRILTRLTDATMFDEFLRKKFLGAKTFSLEGCETLLPLLDLAMERAGNHGVRDIVIGMAHRGRLNVLAHIAGKNPCKIFKEFADARPELWQGRGDVKHHLGHSGQWTTSSGRKIHISLCFNPSHLEFINPIVLGRVRARQDRTDDIERRGVLSLLIHGDAAFAGEGIVQESLNLSRLAGYNVGGALHVILNNQIGFTTPPEQYCSTRYATDVALLLQAPIFHVNGEDPEAVARVVRLALDFRQEFLGDVFIDLQGYRRLGHNETDEPSFTQPVLCRAIAQHKTVREHYLARLLKMKEVTAEEAEQIAVERHKHLEAEFAAAKNDACEDKIEAHGVWENYCGGPEPAEEIETAVPAEKLSRLLRKLTDVPAGFHAHPKIEREMETRRQMAGGEHRLDWGAAEALALATLATEGVRIRLSGQDAERGTFSHRHAIFHDHQSGFPYSPFQHLGEDQGPVEILNSPLCEGGALGFEYGYSLDCPGGLIVWEAQFGDFVNAAQVIVDQFIAGGEDKWQRHSGLVLLLPHGFEGMGPEHSSARPERFLALAAKDNIQIVQPTTPAQFFHLLRRQALRRWRKPLVVLAPKSLLRLPQASSSLEDLSRGHFQRLLADDSEPGRIQRVLLCSGKIYYDLLAFRKEHSRDDVAIIRLEQLYPLRVSEIESALERFARATPVIWVQEEPLNMGAWRYLHEKFGRHLFGRLPFAVVSRAESSNPATGSAGAHKMEQRMLIERAFSRHASQTAPAAQPKPPA